MEVLHYPSLVRARDQEAAMAMAVDRGEARAVA